MTTLIDQYIAQAEEAEKAQEEAQLQHKKEFLKKAENSIAEALGDLWGMFKPHMGKVSANQREQSLRCHINGEELAELELSPFWIHYSAYRNQVFLHWSEHPVGTQPLCTPETIGAFLAQQRQTYHEAREKTHNKEVNDLASQLRGYGAKNPDEADAALDRLIELEPNQKEKWLGMHSVWLEWYKNQLKHQAYQEQMDAIATEYQVVYGEYCHHYLAIREANREALTRLQAELDETSTIWQFAYGVVANEDGVIYADIHTVYVTTPEPDEDGYLLVLSCGQLKRFKFYHPVWVEGPLMFIPSEDNRSLRGRISHYADGPQGKYMGCVYFNPAVVTAAEVEEMINLAIQPYPAEPEVPAQIAGTGRASQAQRRSIEAATGAEDEF